MIKKITKLKDFGLFTDFKWDKDVDEFKKFNLIYGWNRSGKTTISRAFASCEKKSVYDEKAFIQYPENGEFEFILNDESRVSSGNVKNSTLKIKVFNQDFVEENLSFDTQNLTKPIVYISKENVENVRKLRELQDQKKELEKGLKDVEKGLDIYVKTKDNILSEAARNIANYLFDKSYNKTKSEKRIKEIGLENLNKYILSDLEFQSTVKLSKAEPGKTFSYN